ncbi:MAG: DUF4838 domain-containing protein [Pirellulales bacterium]|nr:DUF4838 domain-containing protein [Pirellulales bacterium]
MTISRNCFFIPAALFIALLTLSARADVSIVVNLGAYRSAEEAGNSENEVDWLDGEPSDDTVCTESFAALELQKYLRMMTGRDDDFAIVDDDRTPEGELVLIGSPATNAATGRLASKLGITAEEIEKLGPEGYRLKTVEAGGRRVTLVAGGGRAGTLYGVYDLLDRMGCRWFSPAEFDEEVPSADWKPAFDASETPTFELRGFRIPRLRGGPPIYHWCARNKLNYWHIDKKNEPLQRKLCLSKLSCGGHYEQAKFLNPLSEYRYNHPRFDGDEAKSADPWPVSESYRGDADGDGKLGYFEAHPEWFPLLDGRRECNDVTQYGKGNFCTSNEEAVAEYTKNFVNEFAEGKYHGASVVEAWTIDGGRWCECPKCKALGSPTDRCLRLINQLDKAIKRAQKAGAVNWPIDIHFLIYSDVLAPPTRPLPDDFDYRTCMGQFFPIKHCYVHTFDDSDCPRNARYVSLLRKWMTDSDRRYRGRVCVGEYYDYGRFENLPACYMHVMADDIPYFHRLGATRFHVHHFPTGRWGSKSLTACQMARQTWNVETDCRAFWDDYFARRYGPAATVMRGYYKSLETMLANIQLLKGWSPSLCTRLDRGQKPLFPDPHMRYRREPGVKCDGPTFLEMLDHCRQCRELIDEARTMDLPERIEKRLAEDERIFAYAEQTLRYYDACVRAYHAAWAGEKSEARRHYEEAKRVADLLRRDSWSVAPGITHHDIEERMEQNAFTATNAVRALTHLAKLLEKPRKDATGERP